MLGGQDVLVVDEHSKGLAPSPFMSFGCLCHSFLKVLENETGGWGGGEMSWWSHTPPQKAIAQFPCLRDIGEFRKLTYCLHGVSLGLPHSLIKMRKFQKHNA